MVDLNPADAKYFLERGFAEEEKKEEEQPKKPAAKKKKAEIEADESFKKTPWD
jgi:hypothetical protein